MTTKKRSTLMEANPASPSTSDLGALFNGRVIAPDDPRYEKARQFSLATLTVTWRHSLYS